MAKKKINNVRRDSKARCFDLLNKPSPRVVAEVRNFWLQEGNEFELMKFESYLNSVSQYKLNLKMFMALHKN